MTSEHSPEVTSPVTDALVQLSFAVLEVLSRSAAEIDLSVTQLRLIGILRDRSPSMAALAEFLGLDRSSVSGLIDRAERRGLVARRQSADDARVTLIDLAPTGRELGAQLGISVSARMEPLLHGLSAADRDRLVQLASQVIQGERFRPPEFSTR